ncbi:MAG: hypothetical protein U0835_15395 [Isosphaeraceae bacterium]
MQVGQAEEEERPGVTRRIPKEQGGERGAGLGELVAREVRPGLQQRRSSV